MASTSLIKPAEGLTFKTKKLQDAYNGMQEAYTEASTHVEDARKALESYAQRMGKIFARLSTDKSGKLDPKQNDGYKSVGEFAEKCGIKSGTAYAWRNWALAQEDEHLLPDIKALPISTYAALQSQLKSNEAEVVKAFKEGKLSKDSSQDDVKTWSKAQREKNGKPTVVTTYELFDFVTHEMVTEEVETDKGEFAERQIKGTIEDLQRKIKSWHPAGEIFDLPNAKVTLNGKDLTAKRFLLVRHKDTDTYGDDDCGVCNAYIAVPVVKVKTPISGGQDLNRKAKWTEAVSKAKALGLSDESIAELLSDLYPEFYK